MLADIQNKVEKFSNNMLKNTTNILLQNMFEKIINTNVHYPGWSVIICLLIVAIPDYT